jgi:hypothetical protein
MKVVEKFVWSMATAASVNGACMLISTGDRNCRAGLFTTERTLSTRRTGSAVRTPARAMMRGP